MRRILAAIVTALAMLGLNAGTAHAATVPTFQLTADETLAPYAAKVASIWSANNLGVKVVVVSDCTGPRCIHGVIQDSGYLGLTSRTDDGSYTATVSSFVAQYGPDAVVDTFAHEAGHGVIHSLGGGYWHASNARDLMSASHYPGDPLRRITKETRDYLRALL